MIRRLAAAVLVLCLAQSATAQQAKPAAPDPAATAFKAWDRNADGQLSLVEFRAGWQQAQTASKIQATLRRQFATLDANHDNAIDAAEYGNLLLIKQAGKAAPPLARFDGDGDGKLDFTEYAKLVETLAPHEAGKGAKK
ncbi:EF-hand domain-containing protein [Thermomonas brevis]|jgi:Ca2+-binding EF-hand superfamily protein